LKGEHSVPKKQIADFADVTQTKADMTKKASDQRASASSAFYSEGGWTVGLNEALRDTYSRLGARDNSGSRSRRM
jgi:hypothetical protein